MRLNQSGFALPVAIVAKCEEEIFLAQKNFIWRKQVAKKILLPKNRHHLGCFMSFNRQLTSWITCLKSVADQLIHDDNNSPHCLQLLKRVKLFCCCCFFFDIINFSWHLLIFDLSQRILGTLTFCEGPWDNLTLLHWYNLTQHRAMPLHDFFCVKFRDIVFSMYTMYINYDILYFPLCYSGMVILFAWIRLIIFVILYLKK